MCFNLLDKPWIPVLRRNGAPDRVGMRRVLAEAAEIRGVHAAGPLDTVALYRFLLAVLQWCKPGPSPRELGTVREAEGFPASWLKALKEHRNRFALLGQKYGFYQDPGASHRASRPATDLLQELPSGTNVAHFRHSRDARDGLCPACCALGVIRLSAFATHSAHPPYPGGKPSGINGGTPVYALPLGQTLLQTLLLNWPMPTRNEDRPAWVSDEALDADKIGCLAAFTWRPRRVWLERPKADAATERCAHCASEDRLIHRVAFLPGWKRPFGKNSWPEDPHLLLHIEEPKSARAKTKAQPISLPRPSNPLDWHARSWRRVYRALLQPFVTDLVKEPLAQHTHLRNCVAKAHASHAVTVACFGPAANQALYQDAALLEWPVPVAGLTDKRAQEAIRELDWLNGVHLPGVLRTALPRNAGKRPEIRAALAAATVQAENRLRQRFERFVEGLASSHPNAVDDWRKSAQDCLADELRRACDVLRKGSALRRQEQQAAVNWELQQATENPPRRTRKGGEA